MSAPLASIFGPDRRTDAEIARDIQNDYARNRLVHHRAAGYWVRSVIDGGNEAAVLRAMTMTVDFWQRRKGWHTRVDPARIADLALSDLLRVPLDIPLARARHVCWPMIERGTHRSDPDTVERAARNAAPGLPEPWIIAELTEIVRQQNAQRSRAARGRR